MKVSKNLILVLLVSFILIVTINTTVLAGSDFSLTVSTTWGDYLSYTYGPSDLPQSASKTITIPSKSKVTVDPAGNFTYNDRVFSIKKNGTYIVKDSHDQDPIFTFNPGTYEFIVTIVDTPRNLPPSALPLNASIDVSGEYLNQAPSINLSNKSVNENNTLTVNLNNYSSDPDGDNLSFSKISGPGYISGDYYKMNTNYYGANDAGSYSVKVKVNDGNGEVDYDWFNVTVNNVWREKDLYEPNPPSYKSYPSLPTHPGPRTTFPSVPTEPAKPYEPLEYDPDTEWTDCTPTTCPDTDDYIDPLSEPENPTNNAKLKTFLADVESSNIEISDIIEGDQGYQQFVDSVDQYNYLMGVLDKVQEVNKQNYEEFNQKAEDYNDEVKSLWNTYETNYNQAESDYNTWLNERQDYLDTVNQIQNIKADNESKKDSYFNGPYDDFYNNTVPYYEARYDNVVIHEKSGKYPPTAPSYSSVDSPYVSKPDYVSRPELLDPKYPGDYVIGNE